MHAGEQVKMKRGAIWACVIPVGIGIIISVFEISRLPETMSWNDFNVMEFHWTLPFAACFILGAPLAAWIACRRLRQADDATKLRRWKTVAGAGLRAASGVHFSAATLYSILTYWLIDLLAGAEVEQWEKTETMAFSAIGNVILWIFITLPLTLLCATIFWKVTKFPDDTSVL